MYIAFGRQQCRRRVIHKQEFYRYQFHGAFLVPTGRPAVAAGDRTTIPRLIVSTGLSRTRCHMFDRFESDGILSRLLARYRDKVQLKIGTCIWCRLTCLQQRPSRTRSAR